VLIEGREDGIGRRIHPGNVNGRFESRTVVLSVHDTGIGARTQWKTKWAV
jgi:hypothetical protein